ncbi:MAG: PKD domain-containing protein [Armatimonadetes bacterium]|nr:PKD domain-containing protein [Armatimonadota bacterium]
MGTRSFFHIRLLLLLLLTTALLSHLPVASQAQDADRDGLPDAIEEQLGTDSNFAERLETLGKFPASAKLPALDIVRVDFGNVAKDRWLWAFHFAGPYTFKNSSLILYLDSDNDPKTGRTDMGCEVMLAHNQGAAGVTAFAPDGQNVASSSPRVALLNGILYLCHDGGIKQENGRSVLRFTVLSETREPHASADSTGWVQANGPQNSERKRTMMLDDITADDHFGTTEGLDLVWKLQADPANVAISSVGGELKGFAYYDTEYRWPAVYGSGGIAVIVPKAGKFYPAIVVYDSGGREAYELQIDGKRVGQFVAKEDDNRQRIHFLSQPVQFKGGEKLTFRTGGSGNHITEDILLLAKKPPVRGRKFVMSNIGAGYVKNDGGESLRLTWTTTWPTACTIEYGTTTSYGAKLKEEQSVANHRIYLSGLKKGVSYHFRIVASSPDGQTVVSKDSTYTLQSPKPFAGKAKNERIPLKVENPYDFPLTAFPISSGVPFAKGELGDAAHVRLLDARMKEVVVQPKTTARWQDGSVKWLLISFMTTVQAKQTATYTLAYGTSVGNGRRAVPTPLEHSLEGDALTVSTGPLQARFDAKQSGFPSHLWFDANSDGKYSEDESLSGDGMMGVQVTDSRGSVFTSNNPPESIEVEEAGPVRIVVKVTGHHVSKGNERFFAYINRFVFYAGSPFVRVYTTWGNDWEGAEFANFESIKLNIPLSEQRRGDWTVGLGNGRETTGQGDLSLRQLRDDSYQMTPAPPAGTKTDRSDGWVDVSKGNWGLTTAVRDFRQLYPKGLQVNSEGLNIDLCPDVPEGTYDKCSKLDEIKWFFYLMDGKYKVRRGVQKQHELMFYFHPSVIARSGATKQSPPTSEQDQGGLLRRSTPRNNGKQMAQAFQEPLIATCTPDRYCSTGVFGEVLPATAGRSPEYEQVCEKVYQGYVSNRERSRDYGMLNFGDQFGERKVNWANGEYDHHHAFLMQFIRTADRKWYFLGEKAARHAIDVDTCHYGPRRGGEWVHAMGHTGGYFKEQYEGDGIPGGGFTPSHTWTEGFCDWYFLSGDPTAAEDAALVADHYNGAYLNNYDFSNCRDNGWNLLLTLAAYRATGDPFHLNAARIIVERTLERQTPGGGWHRQMVPGHCLDFPRHRGEANFMLGVLANGLEEYYREVSDPRVAQAIIGGAKQAVKELWVEEANGFRYTSCPNMKGYTANNDMTSEILFFAYRLAGNPQFADIAMRAMRAAFKDGIGSIAHLRWTHHTIYSMGLCRTTPEVRIEGARSLGPGETVFKLKAGVSDAQGGIASCKWTFDDGATAAGEAVEHRFASPGAHKVTVTLKDKAGKQARASATLSTAPAELANADPERVVLVEAEDFAAQGLDQVRIYDRLGNRGKMITYWDATKGHWLEWEIPIGEEGDYVVYLRYCSGGVNPRRSLTIDGKSPGAAFDDMALPPTGGFCTSEDNWAFLAAGGGAPVHLTAGKYRLRLTNLGDGVGLDYVAVVRR